MPGPVQPAVDLRLLEQMSRGLPDDDGFHTPAGVADVEEMAERAGCVVLGPGLGRNDGAKEFALGVAVGVEAPLLVDADGLNAHAGRLELFRERDAPTVLTPHEAELGRLLGEEPEEIAAHRVRYAREAAERSGAVVVLKGDDTIVARPGGPLAISPGGSPALATAGTGDVLSGLIGALLAKRMDAFEAAALGVLAHARAAEAAAELVGVDHVMAGRRHRGAASRPVARPTTAMKRSTFAASVLPRGPIWDPSQDGAPVFALMRAVARIDLGAVERNCARLPKPLCAVVKANAYGHGAGPVAEAALSGGAEWLAVATAAEAAELRALGIDARLLVMGALTSGELRTAIEADADIVAWSDEVAEGGAAHPRQARHRHGPPRHEGPRARAAPRRAPEHGWPDDALRDRRRAG